VESFRHRNGNDNFTEGTNDDDDQSQAASTEEDKPNNTLDGPSNLQLAEILCKNRIIRIFNIQQNSLSICSKGIDKK
jgi:hypothetical protein